MLSKITSFIDFILSDINKNIYANLEDYCFIDSIANKSTFLSEDGSLATVVKIKGINKTIVSEDAMLDTSLSIYDGIRNFFKENGHILQIYFSREPNNSEFLLMKQYSMYRETAKKMGLDLDFYFDDKINKLKNFIVHEECVMVLWSRPTLLKTIKKDSEEIKEKMLNSPLAEKAQDTHLLYKSLMLKHEAFCESLLKTFKSVGIYTEVLHVKKASNLIKSTCEYSRTGENWTPKMHIDDVSSDHKNKPIIKEQNDEVLKSDDISYFLYPKLKRQFVPSIIEKIDETTLKLNSEYLKIFKVDLPQETETKFSDFLNRIDDSIPYQISFKMCSGGLNNIGFKNLLATLLSFDKTTDNSLVKDSIKYFLDLEKKEGLVFSKNSISIIVRGETEDILNKRSSIISTELQNWGNQHIIEECGDLYGSYFNTLPLYTPKVPIDGNFVLPFQDVIYSLPITRPVNIEENGLITYRTEDNKMINYDSMSSLLNYFNELICATPGSGKSVKSNSNNLAFLLKKKGNELFSKLLPLLFIIDIGPSSQGMIEFLKSIAPPHMKEMFKYIKIENSKEHTINILDTPLGCRILPSKLNSLVTSFLIMLTTPVGKDGLSEGMVGLLVKKTYIEFSDKGKKTKIYESGQLPEIDKALKDLGFAVNPKTTWWNIVDFFFQKDKLDLARIAQSEAVPKLINLVEVLKSDEDLKSTYEKVMIGKESASDVFVRLLSESLELYPIFNGRTSLNLSSTRVLSFDLNDVAPDGKGDPVAAKQSALMYTMSTIYGLRNFFFEENTFKSAPAIYQNYLKNCYKEYRSIPKRFVVDEFHRGASVPKFNAEIIRMLRESRKWNMSNCLISQYLDDFSGEISELCSVKFILSAGDNYKSFQKAFNLSDDIALILKSKLTGPTSKGLPFVVDLNTKEGKFTLFLYSTLSGIELWANTSTSEDVEIYKEVVASFGVEKGLKTLSKEYGGGTVKSILEKDSTGKISINYLVQRLKDKYINI